MQERSEILVVDGTSESLELFASARIGGFYEEGMA